MSQYYKTQNINVKVLRGTWHQCQSITRQNINVKVRQHMGDQYQSITRHAPLPSMYYRTLGICIKVLQDMELRSHSITGYVKVLQKTWRPCDPWSINVKVLQNTEHQCQSVTDTNYQYQSITGHETSVSKHCSQWSINVKVLQNTGHQRQSNTDTNYQYQSITGHETSVSKYCSQWSINVKVLQNIGHQRQSVTRHGFVCWLLNVPATCQCISGTDLHRQFNVLRH